MKKTIEFLVEAPVKCTDKQFEEWIRYHLGYDLMPMEPSNPLTGYDMVGNIYELNIDGEEMD